MSVVVHTTNSQPPPQVVQVSQPQQAHVVVVQQPGSAAKYGCCGLVRESYKAKVSKILGWIQIILAILCIIFNSVGMHTDHIYNIYVYFGYYNMHHTGYGIWSAIFYLLSGGFALGAGIHKTTGMIVTNMVFSIIAGIIGFSAIGYGIACLLAEIHHNYYAKNLAMAVLLFLALVTQFVCTIWSSALCCAVVCCGARNPQVVAANQGQATVYVNNQTTSTYPATQMAQPPAYIQTMPGPGQPQMVQGQYPPGQYQQGQYQQGQYQQGQYQQGQPGMSQPQQQAPDMPQKY